MRRKDITEFLCGLLMHDRLGGRGKYWAREVSLDYGTVNVRRVDFMQFCPVNQIHISGIEKGMFICYEVKSCKADFKSGNGWNFIGEKNYFVMPMCLYKEVMQEIPDDIGVLVPIPENVGKYEEFDAPTSLDAKCTWKLTVIKQAHLKGRERSMAELLFCMLRSGK